MKPAFFGLWVGACVALLVTAVGEIAFGAINAHPAHATPTYLSNLLVDDSKAVANGIPIFSLSGQATAATVADASTGSAGAAVSATLPATAGKTTRLLGFSVTAGSVLAAVGGTVTVGTLVNSKTFSYTLTIAVATGTVLTQEYPVPVPAFASNTAITVSVPAITGGSAVAVNVWGDQV